MKAIILCAGYATRMFPITENFPKALLELGGKPIIDYIVDEIRTLPIENIDIYVVTNERYYPHFLEWSKKRNNITVINDGTTTNDNRLGAIGDIRFTISKAAINEDVLIMAGDNFLRYPLREQYESFLEKGDTVAAMRISDKEAIKAFAVAQTDSEGYITDLTEKPEEPKSDLAVFASYFYKKETLPLFEEYWNNGEAKDAPGYFLQWLHKRRPVYAYAINGECFDIGTIPIYEAMRAKMG